MSLLRVKWQKVFLATSILLGDLGIGIADFTPQGLFYGAEEGVNTIKRGLNSGDNLSVAMGALEAGLSFAEAVPLQQLGQRV